MTGLIPLEEARAHVLEHCAVLPAVRLPLDQALGLVTAETLISDQSIPPFANTGMDGYALRAADTTGASPEGPARLQVIGTLAAGQAPEQVVRPGQAIRIMTGAPIPDGADAVVMVELTRTDGPDVLVERVVPVGESIRRAGDDIRPGDEVIPVGTLLGPAHLGVAASLGTAEVLVHRRPRVGVLSTGDELTDGPGALRPGQIRDSNRHTLLALLRQSGCEAVDLGIVGDREDDIVSALGRAGADLDAVLTSGGVSVGDFDYVKVALDRLCPDGMRWMQVAVRPAKPFAFGRLGGNVPVFGLPGNPVSSAVSFELFARPALRQMMGQTGADRFRPRLRAVAAEGLRAATDGRLSLVRAWAFVGGDGRVQVRSAGGQGSHVLSALARSNGLALVPAGTDVAAGQEVDVWLLGELSTPEI